MSFIEKQRLHQTPLCYCIQVIVKVIAHRVRNFHMLKNKYDHTLRQSNLHTASNNFSRFKEIQAGFDFLFLRSIHFKRCFDTSETQYKRAPNLKKTHSKISMCCMYKDYGQKP